MASTTATAGCHARRRICARAILRPSIVRTLLLASSYEDTFDSFTPANRCWIVSLDPTCIWTAFHLAFGANTAFAAHAFDEQKIFSLFGIPYHVSHVRGRASRVSDESLMSGWGVSGMGTASACNCSVICLVIRVRNTGFTLGIRSS